MGMGQSFLSGYSRRTPIHHIDISPYLKSRRESVSPSRRGAVSPSSRQAVAPVPSASQRWTEEERYREKMDLEKDKWATEKALKEQELEAKKQEELLKRQQVTKELEMKDLQLRKAEQELALTDKEAARQAEQQRRINGWNQALVGLQYRDPDLIAAGMKNMIPGGFQRIAESKTADGARKFSTAQVVPEFAFGADGKVTVKFPNGEAASADPDTIAKMVLYPLWPGAEQPAGKTRKEPDFYNKEEYKSLLEEREALQKAVSTGVDEDGARFPEERMETAKARLAEIDARLKALSGEDDGKGLQFAGREKTQDATGEKAKPLDKETAKAILKEAGGDKDKARQIALARGYSLGGERSAPASPAAKTGQQTQAGGQGEPPPTAARETVKKMNQALSESGAKRSFAVDPETGKVKSEVSEGKKGKGASGKDAGGDEDGDKKKKKKKKKAGGSD